MSAAQLLITIPQIVYQFPIYSICRNLEVNEHWTDRVSLFEFLDQLTDFVLSGDKDQNGTVWQLLVNATGLNEQKINLKALEIINCGTQTVTGLNNKPKEEARTFRNAIFM